MKNYTLLILYFIYFISGDLISSGDHFEDTKCSGKILILQIVGCVLNHSPEYKVAKYEIGALEGKKKVAAYLFPSNPYLTITQAGRKGTGGDFLNPENGIFYNGEILISQEIFLSAQRSTRLKIANSELNSSERKLLAIERNTISEAFNAVIYYQFAREETILYESLYKISEDIYRVISTRSQKGLSPPIEADLAESEKFRAFRALQIARRNQQKSKINLTVMMGIKNELPLEIIDEFNDPKYRKQDQSDLLQFALQNRPEVESNEFLVQANVKKLELYHNEKIPNPIFSAYVQKDGFNENVVGGRISLPLRVWRDQSGEIHEGKYRLEQAKSIAEVNRHTISLEILKAYSDYESLKYELDSYSPELIKKIETNMEFLKKALLLGQVNLKEALILQQSFLNVKINLLGTRLQYALAGIELLRASGEPIIRLKESSND